METVLNHLAIQPCPKFEVHILRLPTSGSSNLLRLGGAEEDRTPDPLLAKQVLSQLSYSPIPAAISF
jgi:hypothetical protein